MSLHNLAHHVRAKGRGKDTMLVHMTPREVQGLQALAKAKGGTLTINPETGLPEAGFYGTLGRNTLQGPGLAVANLSIHKTLWNRENVSLKLRTEVFNPANRPNFQVPADLFLFDSTGRRVGSAGRIAETATGSRQLQVALRLEF